MEHISTNEISQHGTLRSYTIGFVLSIVLTLAAYYIVVDHVLTGRTLVVAIVGLGLLQLAVQLLLFLHVGREEKPHWNLAALAFAAIIVVIVIGGTLWIMSNLQHGNSHEPFENGVVTPQTEG